MVRWAVESRVLRMTSTPRHWAPLAWVLWATAATGSVLVPHRALAQAPQQVPAVVVEPAATRALAQQSEFIGRIEAVNKVEIRARIEGFLGPRLFADGDMVRKDQVLFTLERASYEAALDQQKAALASAQSTLANADVQFKRAQDLSKTNNIALSQLDQREADLQRAKADVMAAEASVRSATVTLSYTEIRSPIDGRIGRALVSPGNLVSPATGVLATIVEQNPVQVLFSVTQRELQDARRTVPDPSALKVRVRLPDGTFYPEIGRIDFLDVQADSRTDSQAVRAVIANPKAMLVPGQTIRVVVETAAPEATVVVPESALALDQGGSFVFVVSASDIVEQRRLKLGVSRDGLVAVIDGLKAGEPVIVQGQQRVRPGMTVAPQRAPAAR
jgi:membrane fusion protein, multidrug efflux system